MSFAFLVGPLQSQQGAKYTAVVLRLPILQAKMWGQSLALYIPALLQTGPGTSPHCGWRGGGLPFTLFVLSFWETRDGSRGKFATVLFHRHVSACSFLPNAHRSVCEMGGAGGREG